MCSTLSKPDSRVKHHTANHRDIFAISPKNPPHVHLPSSPLSEESTPDSAGAQQSSNMKTLSNWSADVTVWDSSGAHVPGTAPRPELSKNCVGWLRATGTLERVSKNLLLGESRNAFFGELSSVSVRGGRRLVGVHGASRLLSLILYALRFHLLISSCCLLIRLQGEVRVMLINKQRHGLQNALSIYNTAFSIYIHIHV